MRLKLIVGSLVMLNLTLLTMLLVSDGTVPPVAALTAPETSNTEATPQPAPVAQAPVPLAPVATTEQARPSPPLAELPAASGAELPAASETTGAPPPEPAAYEPVTRPRPNPAPRQAPAPAEHPVVRPSAPVAEPAPETPRREARPPAPEAPAVKVAEVRTTAEPRPLPATPPLPAPPRLVSVPAGTILPVRLVNALDSRSLEIGQSFAARLDEDLWVGRDRIARAGSRVTGVVRDIQESGRVKGVETLVLALEELETEDELSTRIETSKATFTAPESHKRDAVTIGGASAVGAIIGGIARGGKGAATGAAAGAAAGAGVVLTSRGEPVHLEAGTQLMFTLEHELRVPLPPAGLH